VELVVQYNERLEALLYCVTKPKKAMIYSDIFASGRKECKQRVNMSTARIPSLGRRDQDKYAAMLSS
jgi:hypothetical protein